MLLLDQRLVTTRHGGGHVDGSLATGPVVRHEHDGFGRVLQHQSHLRIVGNRRVHICRDPDRHHKLDIGQGIAQAVAGHDVRLGESAMLARLRIEEIQAVRSGTKPDLCAFQPYCGLTVAVTHHDAAGC